MKSRGGRRAFWATMLVAAGALVVVMAAGGAGTRTTLSYPRGETLYTGGTQWGNVVGFNPYVGNYATGTVGLVNETLFRYDPLKDTYIPWLAKSGTWTSPTVYTLTSDRASSGATGRRSPRRT